MLHSDVEGRYQIDNVPAGIYSIEASFIGYRMFSAIDIKVSAGDAVTVNVNLRSEALSLDDVVVTPGSILDP